MENLDENKVLKMCQFHDIEETTTEAANFIRSYYTRKNTDQLDNIPIEKDITEILQKFKKEQSPESIVSKDADLISQLISQWHTLKNSKNRQRWNRHTFKKPKNKISRGACRKNYEKEFIRMVIRFSR